jgi:hypothetical protein
MAFELMYGVTSMDETEIWPDVCVCRPGIASDEDSPILWRMGANELEVVPQDHFPGKRAYLKGELPPLYVLLLLFNLTGRHHSARREQL